MYSIQSHPDHRAFAHAATDFLMRDEAFYCLPIGLLDYLRRVETANPEDRFWTIHEGSDVAGIAWWTPPRPLGFSRMPENALGAFLAYLQEQGVRPSGVILPTEMSERVFQWFLERAGLSSEHDTGLRVFRLDKVTRPRSVSGSMRVVQENDCPLVEEWIHRFNEDCHLVATREDARQAAERLISDRSLFLWEVDGRPVTMTGISGKTPHGIRVNAVYTPPELRGRGFASQLVADVSQAQLDAGNRYCFLFTDLANPTSNSIYQKLGYRPVGDWSTRRFK
jgi:predicted GNAT family acetyltransferase